MALLYQEINKIPGLTGSNSFQKQADYWKRLGLGGNYTGSYSQNTQLLNQIKRPNFGIGTPVAGAIPQTGSPSQNLINQYVKAVVPKPVQTPTSFGNVVNKDQFINKPLVEQFAYSQVDPEINRIRERETRNLNEQQAQSGMYRFGMAGRQQRDLSDAISRQRAEMAQPFMQQGLKTLGDYYNDLQTEYYKDPQAFQYKPLDVNKLLTTI